MDVLNVDIQVSMYLFFFLMTLNYQLFLREVTISHLKSEVHLPR